MKDEKTTIRDIVPYLKWKDVKRAIKYFYSEDKNDYEQVFEYLKTIPRTKQIHRKEFIEVYCSYDITAESFKEKCEGAYYGIATNKHSMSFRKWDELSNVLISEETLKHHSPIDIVAHFIWEITYYGNQKDTAKVEKQVFSAYKECLKELKK